MSSSQVIILCLNPKCSAPDNRCLDSRSIRTHPSQCSPYYFSSDAITQQPWSKIPDYPNDILGKSVNKKLRLNQNQKEQKQKSYPYIRRITQSLKNKILSTFDLFYQKLTQILPQTHIQDLYNETYSLQGISKYLKQNSNSNFISKCINTNFSHLKYGQLELINNKINSLQQTFEQILSNIKSTLRTVIDEFAQSSKKDIAQLYRKKQTVNQKKIKYGLVKSKFIGSKKIEYENGKILFPKIQNIASFLPWIYSDHGFSVGVHQLKIHSLRFPSNANCGIAILEQHDIDTYPYHYYKSLFNNQGKGFKPAILKDQLLQFQYTKQKQNQWKKFKAVTEPDPIQSMMGQNSQVIVRLQLNSTPQAILKIVDGTCLYVCDLLPQRKYRFGVYGCGWAVSVVELW